MSMQRQSDSEQSYSASNALISLSFDSAIPLIRHQRREDRATPPRPGRKYLARGCPGFRRRRAEYAPAGVVYPSTRIFLRETRKPSKGSGA